MMMQKLKNDALWCKSAKNLAICFIYEASINLWCDLTTLQKTHLSASFIHAFWLLLQLGTSAVWVVSPRSPQSVIIRSTVPIIGEHNRHSTTAQQQHSSRANDNSSLQHRSQCLLPPLNSYTRQLNHNSHRNKLWEFWSKLQMFNESNFCCLLFLVQAPHYLFIDHQL